MTGQTTPSRPGLFPLHLSGGGLDVWCAAACDEAGGLLLVDCGGPDQWRELGNALAAHGLSVERVRAVLLTHQDYDHAGNLLTLLERSPGVEILCGQDEAPYLSRTRKYLHQERMERLWAQAGDPAARAELDTLARLPAVTPSRTFSGEIRLDWGGEVRVIPTPGHTPGHISVYFPRYRTLISGDALRVEDGGLVGPNPIYTHDMATALRSLRALSALDVETVVCAHGGLYRGDPHPAILRILERHGLS